jgi:hypothetical protein
MKLRIWLTCRAWYLRAMRKLRVQAKVIGPAPTGGLVVRLRNRDVVVPPEQLPKHLRTPSSRFVAIVSGRELLGVESAGPEWLRLQDEVRAILNANWDPIGVADIAPDEYDDYIGPICQMMQSEAKTLALVEFLRMIETQYIIAAAAVHRCRATSQARRQRRRLTKCQEIT